MEPAKRRAAELSFTTAQFSPETCSIIAQFSPDCTSTEFCESLSDSDYRLITVRFSPTFHFA